MTRRPEYLSPKAPGWRTTLVERQQSCPPYDSKTDLLEAPRAREAAMEDRVRDKALAWARCRWSRRRSCARYESWRERNGARSGSPTRWGSRAIRSADTYEAERGRAAPSA